MDIREYLKHNRSNATETEASFKELFALDLSVNLMTCKPLQGDKPERDRLQKAIQGKFDDFVFAMTHDKQSYLDVIDRQANTIDKLAGVDNYRITVFGDVGSVTDEDGNVITDNDVIKQALDSADDQTCFSDYFHGRIGSDDNEVVLIDIVKGGYMKFYWRSGPIVAVNYTSKNKLNNAECQVLREYTSGQLSDGVGEGFEQNPCTTINGQDIYISPWSVGQILHIKQIKI